MKLYFFTLTLCHSTLYMEIWTQIVSWTPRRVLGTPWPMLLCTTPCPLITSKPRYTQFIPSKHTRRRFDVDTTLFWRRRRCYNVETASCAIEEYFKYSTEMTLWSVDWRDFRDLTNEPIPSLIGIWKIGCSLISLSKKSVRIYFRICKILFSIISLQFKS